MTRYKARVARRRALNRIEAVNRLSDSDAGASPSELPPDLHRGVRTGSGVVIFLLALLGLLLVLWLIL